MKPYVTCLNCGKPFYPENGVSYNSEPMDPKLYQDKKHNADEEPYSLNVNFPSGGGIHAKSVNINTTCTHCKDIRLYNYNDFIFKEIK